MLDTAAWTQSAVAAGTLIQIQRVLEPTLGATFGDVADFNDSLIVDSAPKLEAPFALALDTAPAPDAALRPDAALAPGNAPTSAGTPRLTLRRHQT